MFSREAKEAMANGFAKELRLAGKEYETVWGGVKDATPVKNKSVPSKTAALETPKTIPTMTVDGKPMPDIQQSVPKNGNTSNLGDDINLSVNQSEPTKYIDLDGEGKPGGLGEYIIAGQENLNPISPYDYKKVFFDKYPEQKGKVVVHHSIEQQVAKRFSDLFTAEELNDIGKLRGIPKDLNNTIHLSEIRKEWNKFYRVIMKGEITPTKENFLRKAIEVDALFGSKFDPPMN